MLKLLREKLKEAVSSVFPVVLVVVILNFTPLIDLSKTELTVFLLSAVGLILGIGLFSLGADIAMSPMGEHIGAGLSRHGGPLLLLPICFLMGLLITVAEPDLSVLASQVEGQINGTFLIVMVGIGVGLFLVLSILKIIFRLSLSYLLMFFYLVMFMASSLLFLSGNSNFLALGFDSGGVTTGPITVPFIMALGVGIAATIGGKNVGENSFGLIAMCSVGPIIAVLLLGSTLKGDVPYALPDYSVESHLGKELPMTFLHTASDVLLALGLVVGFFLILDLFCLKLPLRKLLKIGVGILFTFTGLVVFLSAVEIGFMPVGFKMGTEIAGKHPAILIGFGFLIGFLVVLAEPAVQVLNRQVEDITDGTVSKKSMMIALSIGVGLSIALSMLRIRYHFSVLYYLIPGYALSLGLSFFVPGLYTAIAFDSGGVASGPLTSSFILPFAIGACCTLQGEAAVMTDAFGVVAMVAMTPLITIQLLGFRAIVTNILRRKLAMKRILSADDEQVINFM